MFYSFNIFSICFLGLFVFCLFVCFCFISDEQESVYITCYLIHMLSERFRILFFYNQFNINFLSLFLLFDKYENYAVVKGFHKLLSKWLKFQISFATRHRQWRKATVLSQAHVSSSTAFWSSSYLEMTSQCSCYHGSQLLHPSQTCRVK